MFDKYNFMVVLLKLNMLDLYELNLVLSNSFYEH